MKVLNRKDIVSKKPKSIKSKQPHRVSFQQILDYAHENVCKPVLKDPEDYRLCTVKVQASPDALTLVGVSIPTSKVKKYLKWWAQLARNMRLFPYSNSVAGGIVRVEMNDKELTIVYRLSEPDITGAK